MSLFAILNVGSQGLGVHRGRLNAASHNLANVNTPGFSRRRVELGAMPGVPIGNGSVGGGVEVLGINRARDRFLEAQVGKTYGQAAQSEAERNSLFSVRVFDIDAPNKITTSMTSFFSAMRALGQTPDDMGVRQEVFSSIDMLSSSFQTAASELDGARRGIDRDLEGITPVVNEMVARIAVLNREIDTAVSTGRDPNDLMDERGLLAERVSVLTGATPIADERGNVNLFLDGQIPLVIADRAAQLSLVADPTNNGHMALQIVSADGTGPRALPNTRMGGTMGGLLDARDGAMRTAADNLDVLAFEMAAALNTAHGAGFGLDGSTGRALVTAGPTLQGAARSFARDPAMTDTNFIAASATAAGIPGDGDNAFLLADVERQTLPSGQSAEDFANNIVASFGQAARRADGKAGADGMLRDRLDQMRAEVSGVSTDEELVAITEAQRAFEAMSKVIQTTDSLLETVISLK